MSNPASTKIPLPIPLPTKISYGLMVAILALIGWLHLSTLVLTVLFGYFALQMFSIRKNKVVGVAIYIVVVIGVIWGLIFVFNRVQQTLPEIANKTIPAIVNYAEKHNIELPFTDYVSAKTLLIQESKDQVANFGRYLKTAVLQIAMFLIGLVAAVSLFLSGRWGTEADVAEMPDSLYATVVRELGARVRTFYKSFSRVIGAQILISAINTGLTAVFLIWNGFNYTTTLIGATFLCGLLPIIGNIISNTLICGVAFATSPKLALIALAYLVIIHKLEYFLNSKIIGDRIKNPMWLTLFGIVLGEKLMGIPGMILAPVVLHYIKVEASKNKVTVHGVESAHGGEMSEAAGLAKD
jgi:predicted PurR-regulated permease PerM